MILCVIIMPVSITVVFICFAFRESKGARAQTKQGFQKKPGEQDNRKLNEASSWRYHQDKSFLYFYLFLDPYRVSTGERRWRRGSARKWGNDRGGDKRENEPARHTSTVSWWEKDFWLFALSHTVTKDFNKDLLIDILFCWLLVGKRWGIIC